MKMVALLLLVTAMRIASAQNDPTAPLQDLSREIWDTGFLQKRPQPAIVHAKPRTPIHYKPTLDTPKEVSTFSEAAVGLTIWRLRPPTAKDREGSRLLIQDTGNDMVPERVDPIRPLHVDDRIRIAIEVPRHGFLYVIDRESYRNGSFGDPVLIFPTQNINHGDNEVEPGHIIEIPPQKGPVHALRLTKSGDQHTGEDLILIVSPHPIRQITPAEHEQRLSATLVQQWERDWLATSLPLGLEGSQSKPWTSTEKNSGDADIGYVLTQNDPMPSTIVGVAPHGDKPLLIHFPIPIQ